MEEATQHIEVEGNALNKPVGSTFEPQPPVRCRWAVGTATVLFLLAVVSLACSGSTARKVFSAKSILASEMNEADPITKPDVMASFSPLGFSPLSINAHRHRVTLEGAATMVAPRLRRPQVAPSLRQPQMQQNSNSELLDKLKELESSPADETDGLPSELPLDTTGLDDSVSGSTVLSTPAVEKHEKIFQLGVRQFGAGSYKLAVTSFTQAIAATPGGLTGRMGGQYAIWLAQALQAQGRNGEAVTLLKSVESHPDGDVRKVADSVRYIMEAPELEQPEGTFIKINMDAVDLTKEGRLVRVERERPPEKYSLEWYQKNFEARQAMPKKQPRQQKFSTKLAGAVVVLLFGTVGLLIANRLGYFF